MGFHIAIFLATLLVVNGEDVPGYAHRTGDCTGVGVDIKVIGTATRAMCATACDEIAECRSFIYVEQAESSYCWLKNNDCKALSRTNEGYLHFYNKIDFSTIFIPGVTDDPSRLVTIHSYKQGVSDTVTAACALPDEPGLGLIDSKTLALGQSVQSQDCKTYTCLRVFETAQFDVALISEFFGCWYQNNCYMVGAEFRDDRCYRRTCEIVRSKVDGKIRSNIKFVSTVGDCPTADGGCVGPRAAYFDCFLNGAYESHCICKKKGSIVFLDSLMRFGAKIATVGGNANGTYCFFKFKADGQTHNGCILGNRTRKWCAVTADYDRDKRWGYCTESPRYRYTKDDLKCHLPFKYNGMLYHDCTTDGSENGEAWCSTQFKYDPAKKGICDFSHEE